MVCLLFLSCEDIVISMRYFKSQFLFIVLIVITCSTSKVVAQQIFNCDSLLKEEVHINPNEPQATIMMLKQLRYCGIDSIDAELLLDGAIVGPLCLRVFYEDSVVTYGGVLKRLLLIVQDEMYLTDVKPNATFILANREAKRVQQHKDFMDAQPKVLPVLKECKGYELRITRFYMESLISIEDAIKCSKKCNKPILLWFNAINCVNAYKIEDVLNKNDTLRKYINSNFVLLDVYVDSRDTLPKSNVKFSKDLDREIHTWGDFWADYQMRQYKSNYQPVLYIINAKEDVLSTIGYTPDPADIMKFLKKGLEEFNK